MSEWDDFRDESLAAEPGARRRRLRIGAYRNLSEMDRVYPHSARVIREYIEYLEAELKLKSQR